MAKLRVLVVDDDEMVRAQLTTLLVNAQHTAHSLPSAIGVTRAVMQNQIDVVVIDVSMPTLSGDKLATLLRQNPRCKDLGVVLISGRAVEELENLAQEVAADAVVTKSEVRARFIHAVEYAARLRGRTAPR